MGENNPEDVKHILQSLKDEDEGSSAHLVTVLYTELRKLARHLMAKVPPGNTLQATALIHEAYLRLNPADDPRWNSQGHFFGAAAQAMRQILVDQARRKNAVRHGGNLERIDLDLDILSFEESDFNILDLDKALSELEAISERKVNVVLLRFLTGLTIVETAAALEISEPTVERDWRFAQAFLLARLEEGKSSGGRDGRGL